MPTSPTAADIRRGLARHRPSVVVNAAAYTKVDLAESEPDAARRANEIGPGVLADACARAGIPLIHISTDYVFDGSKQGAYVESDAVAPLSVYGRTQGGRRGGGARCGAAPCHRAHLVGLRRVQAATSSRRCCVLPASATSCASSPTSAAAPTSTRDLARDRPCRSRRGLLGGEKRLGHLSFRRPRRDDLARLRRRHRRGGTRR